MKSLDPEDLNRFLDAIKKYPNRDLLFQQMPKTWDYSDVEVQDIIRTFKDLAKKANNKTQNANGIKNNNNNNNVMNPTDIGKNLQQILFMSEGPAKGEIKFFFENCFFCCCFFIFLLKFKVIDEICI